MHRFRTLLAISLLVAFAWSRAAALPLVWCLGSDGHNVIELANSDGCHSTAKIDLYVDSGYVMSLIGPVGDSDCRDIALLDEIQTPAKVFKTLQAPAPADSIVGAVEVRYAVWPVRLAVSVEPTTDNLAHLRTVVLRL